MSEQIFKFVLRRPVMRTSKKGQEYIVIEPYARGLSPFAQSLSNQNDIKNARKIAAGFIASKNFVTRLDLLENGVAVDGLDQWLIGATPLELQPLRDAVARYFPNIPKISRKNILPVLRKDIFRLSDSLLAMIVARKIERSVPETLIRGLRICRMIESINQPSFTKGALKQILQAIVVLPTLGLELKPPPQVETTQKTEQTRKVVAMQDQLVQELNSVQSVITELGDTYSKKLTAARSQPGNKLNDPKLSPNLLTSADFKILSTASKSLLKGRTFPLEIDSTTRVFEEKRVDLEKSLLEYSISSLGKNPTSIIPYLEIPGVPYSPPRDAPVPTAAPGETSGMVWSVGIHDLLMVRQNVKRYEIGEIAHIENVMIGEEFSRTFRRQEGTEITELVENEMTQETQRDLQTTAKFELKNEIEKTVKEEMNVEAGVNVTSTGPGLEVEANAGFEYNRLNEEVNKTATDYAREVVDRSVSRIQERALERRSVRTTRNVEETSVHNLVNKNTEEHTTGIYRWVDKIYEAQVVNYGKRVMYETVVPEPAAFYLFAHANKAEPGVLGIEPEPPLVMNWATGQPRPLMVTDISETNYLLWASRYNVTGITPPPPIFKYASIALELKKDAQSSSDAVSAVVDTAKLVIDGGYEAAEYTITFTSGARADKVGIAGASLQIGSKHFEVPAPGILNEKFPAPEPLNVSIPASFFTIYADISIVNLIVKSRRTQSAVDTWKLKTFSSIMTKYERLKADYEDLVTTARVQEDTPVTGNNPLTNREIEQTELKKLMITMMTGQHFDTFNAMKGPDSTHIFPQIKVDEALQQGAVIKLLEQAFEWRHMTYVFYPYFWARKSRWVDLLNIESEDPLFAKFLRAGAARIQIPMRPGFQAAVDLILSTGLPYPGEAPHMSDDGVPLSGLPHISIVQEIQEQTGLDYETGPGTITVTQGDIRVIGDGTDFRKEDDAEGGILGTKDREIKISGRVYRVKSVISSTEILLASPYQGESSTELYYGLGPRLVGDPWEVKLPTTLVILQGKEAGLNYPTSSV